MTWKFSMDLVNFRFSFSRFKIFIGTFLSFIKKKNSDPSCFFYYTGKKAKSTEKFRKKGILEIYAYYVEYTVISFEWDVPSLEEFENRMRDIMKKYPYLVIEQDGKIEGYAYAHAFVGRAAYDWSSELTIYLDHNARKGGLGRRLYEELADRLKKMGILNLYACIGYPQVEDEYLTKNSAEFHAHLGFELVGTFHNCGYKFDRWYDMVWMEKIIGEPHAGQPAVKSYSEIKE